MTLTVDALIQAILSARDIEALQAEVRNAMVERLMQGFASPLPAST